jgi:hypothetical protein
LDPSLVEDIFQRFRPFGKMNEIILGNYNKDLNSRTATVVYKNMYSAVAARSCLHRALLYSKKHHPITTSAMTEADTIRILITYEAISIIHVISTQINKHTRLFALFLVLLLALLTYTIFDPLREFSCRSKIRGFNTSQGLFFRIDSYLLSAIHHHAYHHHHHAHHHHRHHHHHAHHHHHHHYEHEDGDDNDDGLNVIINMCSL